MLTTDRDEFEVQLKILCAAFDKPLGDRFEAYWKGLKKMSILEFATVVDFCVGDEGPEKLPTTFECWSIKKKLKSKKTDLVIHRPQIDRAATKDNLAFFANRLLLRHIMWRGGLGSSSDFEAGHGVKNCQASPELEACLAVKARLVLEFAGYIRERDELATKSEFVRVFATEINKVSEIAHPERWRRIYEDPRGRATFPPHMAEGISPNGTFDFQ